MTSQEKGNWIRRLFTLGLLLVAAAAGVYFAMPDGWGKADGTKKKFGLQLTSRNLGEVLASKNKLTVINMMVDGSPDSKKLQEILEKLQPKYGEKVVMAELDVEAEPDFAERHGVKKEGFAGQLDFYANSQKLEQLTGQTDPLVVEKTIDRLLAGLVQRISKDWLPEVPGMQRTQGNQAQEVLKIHPSEPAKPSRKP
ncbi:thioredoxin family protein [Luteolibacter soli]|uniref:Thioredoxin domain-containing protein n=1 Tax=Luteolibacter soli TaxID=3135280 RepID=A0ABU9B2C8_9BACT